MNNLLKFPNKKKISKWNKFLYKLGLILFAVVIGLQLLILGVLLYGN